ncbi:plasmid pRiA4b ORF-3 family protein, partial [Martelella alba]|uniref:plasmid pRiA4b ORF-3 family protein n=1 Tax=Martelella alba TaxID=2590451 RepID=UPI001F3FB4E1
MGWEGIHLFLFDVHAVRYGSFDLNVSSPEIALQTFELRENERFSYVYDMGDHWEHEIRVEKISAQAAVKRKRCLRPMGDQVDLLKFQGRSSSILEFGWP